ncbi:cytochrome c-type biogenesis protein CcmH [Sphingorhabdus arenilitoris]|uniref:Cytochrome c-type biogenesis protein n=1 Tax=Sphingorhabdus arenilitoris TaxID=1490041 RepID=A0ABV8RHT7_9SPHN
MKRAAVIIALLFASPVWAQGSGVEPPFSHQQLDDPALEAQATELMETLRCIQCQGQSIADSDAPIAGAMRSEVRQRIKEGQKPEDVRAWLIGRYGEYVSFEPAASGAGLILWFLPLLLLLAGLFMARGLFGKEKP